jgi:hypothetical protein
VSVSEEDLRRAVDDVLQPAWPTERRRARRRWVAATVGRAVLGTVALWTLATVVSLFVGRTLPVTFYVFIGGMAMAAALHEGRDADHLRADGPRGPGAAGR